MKLHVPSIDLAPLPRADAAEPELTGAGFSLNGLKPVSLVPTFKNPLKLYGSPAIAGPEARSARTAWFKAAPRFGLFFTGNTTRNGNALYVEVETAKAGVIRLPMPREIIPGSGRWWLHNFSLPEDKQALQLRVVATLGTSGSPDGYGFSEPFVIRSSKNFEIVKELVWTALAAAAAMVAFIGPGLVLRRRKPRLDYIWIPLAGVPLFAFIGLAAWAGAPFLKPSILCRIGLFASAGYAAYHFFRFPLSTYTTAFERRTLFIFLLLVSIGTAKSIYSLGPAGELFAGKISRTYEVGAKSDSRFSYHPIQLASYGEPPAGAFSERLYAPWSFSSRGPIASLAICPIVLSLRAEIPHEGPDQAWMPFDPQGFEAYRVSMIVLACCGILTVFGLAKLFLPSEWAFFAFLIAATAPFTVHDIFYTWPKLPEAGFVMLSAYLLFRRRYLLAGLAAGFAYLVHPAALMSLPAFAGIAILRKRTGAERNRWIREMVELAVGVGVWFVLWRLVNHGHFAQGYFLKYFQLTAGTSPTAAHWFRSRADSTLNTLVPLNVYLFHHWNLDLQSVYNFSPRVIEFFFVYWNTLPFAVGIGFFLVGLLPLLYIAYRRARAWFFALIVIPFALFVTYWGWSSSGLMREGLHAWFFGLIVFCVVMWHRFLCQSDLFFRVSNWALLFRGIETICLLLVPTIATQDMLVQPPFVLSDTIALAGMAAATARLYFYLFRYAQLLRNRVKIQHSPSFDESEPGQRRAAQYT